MRIVIAIKIFAICLIMVKNTFAKFFTFVEASTGIYIHSVAVESQTSSFSFAKVESKDDKIFFGTLGLGFHYQFNSSFTLGLKIATQNTSDLVNAIGEKIISFSGVPIFISSTLGFKIQKFTPYLLMGLSMQRAKIEEDTSKFLTGKSTTTLGGLFYGIGIEYEIFNKLAILTEYTEGSGKTYFVNYINTENIKSSIEYRLKSFKIGARYYFGK